VLTKLVVGLVKEVTRFRIENTRVVEESARLAAENTQLAEDHARFQDHSVRMTEELKTKNQEITSEWPFFLSLYDFFIDVHHLFLTRIPLYSIKEKCQEAYWRAAEGPRPLEGPLRTDSAGDRAGARPARTGTAVN
jgi:hypothetical protein